MNETLQRQIELLARCQESTETTVMEHTFMELELDLSNARREIQS